MKAHWIIERDVFDPAYTQRMADRLREQGRSVSFIDILAGGIDGRLPKPSGPVVLYGGIGIDDLMRQHSWFPGVFSNPDTFQARVYADSLGALSLNADAFVCPLSKAFETAKALGHDAVFLKPNDDNKAFAGLVKPVGEIERWIERLLETGYLQTTGFDVVVSEPKAIYREWRCIVVDGGLSAASQYRLSGKRVLQAGAPVAVKDLVADLHARFSPAPVYVVDIAETAEGFKVVEYNTFNTAEFYACDVGQIVDDVSSYVEVA